MILWRASLMLEWKTETAVNGDAMEGRKRAQDCLKTWTEVVQTCGTSAGDAGDSEKNVREAGRTHPMSCP